MNFIEEFYYGNIIPNERSFNQGTQYSKALNLFCKNEQKLSEVLSGEELKLFNELINASDEISAVNGVEHFKLGFRLGVQMMCDCLLYNNDKIFSDIR